MGKAFRRFARDPRSCSRTPGRYRGSGRLTTAITSDRPTTSTGSVGVDIVKTIPIPRARAVESARQRYTIHRARSAPPPVQPRKQVKEQPKNAMPIPDKIDKRKKPVAAATGADAFRPPEQYKTEPGLFQRSAGGELACCTARRARTVSISARHPSSATALALMPTCCGTSISQHWNTADVHTSACTEMRDFFHHRPQRLYQ